MDLSSNGLSVSSYTLVRVHPGHHNAGLIELVVPTQFRMPIETTSALNTLLLVNNGDDTARWNYPAAVGTPVANPGGLGTSVALTYSFLASRPSYASSDEVAFGVMDADMKSATAAVLADIAEVANVRFKQVGAQLGQLTFATSDQGLASSAWAYFPSFDYASDGTNITSVTEDKLAGSVWVNNNADLAWTASDWQPGGWGYAVLLHEVGHALGLRHPFQEFDELGNPVWDYVLPTQIDNEAHTVMSYTYAPHSLLLEATSSSWSTRNLSPDSLMPLDIEALQELYGANMSTRSGNSVYSWDRNEELLETIWDGGGADTINASKQIFSCKIDLRAGAYSSIGLRVTDAQIKEGLDVPASFDLSSLGATRAELYNGENNVAIAKGVTIENATGGAGNDAILGNGVGNRLMGAAGADKLSGGAGNDTLVGGLGVDRMTGGNGRDVFDFNKFAEVGKTLAGADTLTDFAPGVDRIDLSTLDADPALSGDQAFTFIGGDAFSGTNAAGQLRFADGVLYGSTDVDNAAEFMIKLTGVVSLSATDIVL